MVTEAAAVWQIEQDDTDCGGGIDSFAPYRKSSPFTSIVGSLSSIIHKSRTPKTIGSTGETSVCTDNIFSFRTLSVIHRVGVLVLGDDVCGFVVWCDVCSVL